MERLKSCHMRSLSSLRETDMNPEKATLPPASHQYLSLRFTRKDWPIRTVCMRIARRACRWYPTAGQRARGVQVRLGLGRRHRG